MLKLERRTVRATKEQTEECKKLLDLMGVPTVQAVGEAEATCAEMVKKGKCWATGTEDMDALTFGTSRQLRHLSVSEAKKQPIHEIHLDRSPPAPLAIPSPGLPLATRHHGAGAGCPPPPPPCTPASLYIT